MITVDHRSTKPLYEQVIDNIKELVVKGVLKEDDPIPSVRKMALLIDVNPNTISKAYRELERENIIINIKGKGAFVKAQNKKKLDKEKIGLTKEKLRPILIELKCFNLKNEEILNLVSETLKELEVINDA